MINRIVTGLLSALLLSGCASSAISVEEAKKYAGLSVTEFLDKRFVGDQRARKFNGTYRFTAFFTYENINYLLRPATELLNYCTAQGGTASRTQVHHGNPVGRYFTSPLITGIQTDVYARSRGATESVTRQATLYAMQDQHALNTYLGERESKRAYEAAVGKGAFGTWECRDGAGGRKWAVSVLPVSYAPRTVPDGTFDFGKEGGGSARILIEITPLTN